MVLFFRKHPFIILVVPFALVFYFVYVGFGMERLGLCLNWTGLRIDYSFAGFRNYSRMFQDRSVLDLVPEILSCCF